MTGTERSSEFDRDLVAEREYLGRFALKLTTDRDEAEDLLQETMLRACMKWEQRQTAAPLRFWLSKIMRNLFLDRRKRAKWPTCALSTEIPEHADPEQRLHDGLSCEAVLAVLARLPELYRRPVEMHEFEGLQVPEIAELLGLEEGAAKMRVYRGRLMIRRQLTGTAVAA